MHALPTPISYLYNYTYVKLAQKYDINDVFVCVEHAHILDAVEDFVLLLRFARAVAQALVGGH